MPDVVGELSGRVRDAVVAAFGGEFAGVDAVIRPSQFADYQANVGLALGRRLGRRPRDVAEEIVAGLRVRDICRTVEVSGPGFINLWLREDWLAGRAQGRRAGPRVRGAGEPGPRA